MPIAEKVRFFTPGIEIREGDDHEAKSACSRQCHDCSGSGRAADWRTHPTENRRVSRHPSASVRIATDGTPGDFRRSGGIAKTQVLISVRVSQAHVSSRIYFHQSTFRITAETRVLRFSVVAPRVPRDPRAISRGDLSATLPKVSLRVTLPKESTQTDHFVRLIPPFLIFCFPQFLISIRYQAHHGIDGRRPSSRD